MKARRPEQARELEELPDIGKAIAADLRAAGITELRPLAELAPLNAPFPGVELWAFPMVANSYGASGALVKMEGHPSGGNSTLVYFN